MNHIYRTFTAAVDDVNKTDRSITAKINDFSIDRYATAIDPRGGDLKPYARNAVVLWEHGKDTVNRGPLPIGKNLWIRVDRSSEPKLIARTQFRKDDFSQMLYEAYSEKEMAAWSVSILPRDFGPPKAEEIRSRPELKECDCVYRTWELAEYSACAIGGNSNCVTVDEARSLNRLIVRGFYVPPAEIKEQLDRALTEGGGLATGGALVAPDTADDSCATAKPKKRKKPKFDDDTDDDGDDDDADDDDAVDEGINITGGGMMAVGASADDAETVTRDAPEPEPVVEPKPVIELPPLTGRTFEEIVAAHILEERHFRHEMKRKFEEHKEWLQGIA